MKFLKINFKALALVLAIGAAFAFNERTAVKGQHLDLISDHYFEWAGGSMVSDYINQEIDEVCPFTTGQECALGFDDQHVDTSVNPPQLLEPAASAPLTYTNDQRFKN